MAPDGPCSAAAARREAPLSVEEDGEVVAEAAGGHVERAQDDGVGARLLDDLLEVGAVAEVGLRVEERAAR